MDELNKTLGKNAIYTAFNVLQILCKVHNS